MFSAQGRIGRQQYLLTLLAVGAMYFVVMSLSGFTFGFLRPALFVGDNDFVIMVFSYLMYVPVLIIAVIAKIKRLHDLDKSGTQLFWFFVPFAGWYIQLLMFLKPGTDGANYYRERRRSDPEVLATWR